MKVSEFVAIVELTGIYPLVVPSDSEHLDQAPCRTLEFVTEIEYVRRSGFTVREIDELLRHQATPESVATSIRGNAITLQQIRDALKKLADELQRPANVDLATLQLFLRQKLALLLQSEEAELVLRWANSDPAALAPGEQPTPAWKESVARLSEFSARHPEFGFLDTATLFQALPDNDEAKREHELEGRYNTILKGLLPCLQNSLGGSLVKQQLSEALDLEPATAEQLLERWVAVPGGDARAITAFLDLGADALLLKLALPVPDRLVQASFPDQQRVAEEAFPTAFQTLTRLRKIALVFSRLRITFTEARFLFGETGKGWLDLASLPVKPTESAALYVGWRRLVDTCQLRDRLGSAEPTLFDLLELAETYRTIPFDSVGLNASNPHPYEKALLERTNWNPADFKKLRTHFGFGIDDFRDERALARIEGCFRVAQELGVTIAEPWNLVDWVGPTVEAETAASIKRAAKAKYSDPQQWLAVARPLQDALRDQKRSALVAYLVHHLELPCPPLETPHPELREGARRAAVSELQCLLNVAGASPQLAVDGIFGPLTRAAVIAFQEANGLVADGIVGTSTWAALDSMRRRLHDSDDLYAHFLIDPEMSACMVTSRIKQAISSVQLYIQRIFLRLENTSLLHDEDAKLQWEWMKNYRVWEANRRIFLYPENWIEPELRDDKSPFFKELERELRQNEITPEYVEKVYLSYLNKLDTVSNLEIVAQCYDSYCEWSLPVGDLHVFARTRNPPYDYYYRNRDKHLVWSPWEKVNVDIDGDHLLPVVWNNRLYLIWPVFKQRAEKVSVQWPSANQQSDSEEQGNLENDVTLNPVTKMFRSSSTPPSDGNIEPKLWWNIRLVWSQYWQGGWTAKQISRESLAPMTAPVVGGMAGGGSLGPKVPVYALDQSDMVSSIAPPYTDNSALFHFAQSRCANNNLNISVYYPAIAADGPYVAVPPMIGADVIIHANQTASIANNNAAQTRPLWVTGRTSFAYSMQANSLVGFGSPTYYGLENEKEIIPLPFKASQYGATPHLWLAREPQHFKITPISVDRLTDAALEFGYCLFVADSSRTFHIEYYNPNVFYHPFVSEFIETIHVDGLDGLLGPVRDKARCPGLYRQRWVEPIFVGDKAPLHAPNPALNVEQLISYPGPHPEIWKPREDITFEDQEAYSLYNWELFFHIPLLIADRLSQNQQFEAAMCWFHYIFDPLTPDPTDPFEWQRPWKFGRFYDNGDARKSVEELMMLLSKESGSTSEDISFEAFIIWYYSAKETPSSVMRKSLIQQIERWRLDPFKPHLLARLRITPYMKTVVMKYLDNLIAWADQLFRRDTIESINEATQLYILAAQILGLRPKELPEREHEDHSFAEIKEELDLFSNALEDEIPEKGGEWSVSGYVQATASHMVVNGLAAKEIAWHQLLSGGSLNGLMGAMAGGFGYSMTPDAAAGLGMGMERPDWQTPGTTSPTTSPSLPPPGLYFCIPQNQKLLGYWDTVADRLFKVRHCMNIEGVVRELPLFEPVIEPGLLVRAAAAGVDFGSVLNDLNAAAPHYRFTVLAERAVELCQEVKALGAALLAALEKQDAETLALLRSEHEIGLLEAVREVRKQQIQETAETLSSLERAKENVETKRDRYTARIDAGRIQEEKDAVGQRQAAMDMEDEAAGSDKEARDWGWVPNFSVGTAVNKGFLPGGVDGGPRAALFLSASASTTTGGMLGVHAHQSSAASKRSEAQKLTRQAEISTSEGGFQRLVQAWQLESDMAAGEVKQIDRQIAATEIRAQIAQKELANHELQMENAKAVDEHLRSKYTNEELYGWMIGHIADVYFQSYQLAYDIAKRAERAYRFELGIADSNFIQFGYWDNLKKGLLAGERLALDLRRLEASYLEKNKREYEITRHVSLVLHDPSRLILLKETGQCEVDLPETLFDADYPGHYFRRIKSASLSIPCVVGPYTSINCTLTLLASRIRTSSVGDSSSYPENPIGADPHFVYNHISMESIATSHAQNDAGLFELNFRDERFLPFEGAGAISRWRIELPKDNNAFDFGSISDVVLNVSYTARNGGERLREAARKALDQLIAEDNLSPPLQRLFLIRHEFPDAWHRFLHGSDPLALELDAARFPYLFRGRKVQAVGLDLYLQVEHEEGASPKDLQLTLTMPGEQNYPTAAGEYLDWTQPWEESGVWLSHMDLGDSQDALGTWMLSSHAGTEELRERLHDLAVVVSYVVGGRLG